MPEISLQPIGTVEAPRTVTLDEGWGSVESRILLRPDLRGALRGLEDFSHVVVVTWLHQAAFDPARHLRRRPRGRADMPEIGIFAQRARDRPNPIGITAVELLEVGEEFLRVRGLDAIDGTPVLDLKPYFPAFDRVEAPGFPAWAEELMKGYF